MSGLTGELDGARRFVETVTAAGRQLVDLADLNRAEGEETLRAAVIPKRTGYLASTAAVDASDAGFALVAGASYAGAVHARDPFFSKALDAREGAIVDRYVEHATGVLSTIRGA